MPDLTLAIETSNPTASGGTGSVCIGHPGTNTPSVILARADLAPASRHDDALMPAIDRVCRDAGARPRDLARLAVSIGPGGFTSVRIAVSTAKMIAEATGAPCVPVPTAIAAAHAAAMTFADGTALAVLLGWKRSDVWRQRFSIRHRVAVPLDGGAIVPVEHVLANGDALIAEHRFRDAMVAAGIWPPSTRATPPTFDARSVLEASFALPAVNGESLLPLYPREPEAVTKWRELKKTRPGPAGA